MRQISAGLLRQNNPVELAQDIALTPKKHVTDKCVHFFYK